MFQVPDWAYEFHGHRCPFMPIGFRMGTLAMKTLGVGRSLNHEMHVYSEMGIGHPQGCLQDGIMSATAATYGKGLMEKLFYGKVAATFFTPTSGGVRIALKPDFMDRLSPHDFFKERKKGLEPSEINPAIANDVIDIVLNADDDELFTVETLPGMTIETVPNSFAKAKCDHCGEYVFERYLRRRNGKLLCIPCAGAQQEEQVMAFPRISW